MGLSGSDYHKMIMMCHIVPMLIQTPELAWHSLLLDGFNHWLIPLLPESCRIADGTLLFSVNKMCALGCRKNNIQMSSLQTSRQILVKEITHDVLSRVQLHDRITFVCCVCLPVSIVGV